MRFKIASVLAVAATFGAVHAASAADLPNRMVTKAPAMVIANSWSGVYVGAHAGAVWSDVDIGDPAALLVPAGSTLGFDRTGFIGGGQIGVNWQFGTWVFGLQGDFAGTTLSKSGVDPFVAGVSATYKTDWLATATARVGYAWNNWLTYVKGGAAWAHNKYALTTPAFNGNGSDTRGGYTVGGGFEYAFAPGWSAFVEYDYVNLGTRGITVVDPAVGVTAGTVKQDMHIAKVGFNFRVPPPR